MAKRGKTERVKRTPAADRSAVSNLLYQYVMLKPDEQREFNRKLRIVRDNSGMVGDLAERFRATANTQVEG